MIGTIITIKVTSTIYAVWLGGLINFATAERVRRFELTRQLGTLACEIDNRRLLGQECSVLQKQYELLAKLVKV